jgi:DNA-binding beta-propeller fold protein YncE
LTEAPSAPEEASAVLLTPDEKRLLIVYEKGPPVVHGTGDLKKERSLGPKSGVYGAAISPDSKLAVIAAADGLSVWRLADGARVATVDFSAGREAPTALAFTPDGTTLWVGTTLGNLHRFSVRP